MPAPARREALRARPPRPLARISRGTPPQDAAPARVRVALIRTRVKLVAARAALAAVVMLLALSAAVSCAADLIRTCWDAGRARLQPFAPALARARVIVEAADSRARVALGPLVVTSAFAGWALACYLRCVLPVRAKAPAAAVTVLALASAVTAASVAIGPAAIAGPAGPAIAAAALGRAPASGPAAPDTSQPAGHPGAHPAAVTVTHRRHRARQHVRRGPELLTWRQITEAAAGHHHGGPLPAYQRLLPAGLSGAQATLPLTPARAANAQLITARALHLHMGIRSAVIAVATAMQESTLENLSYGDRDSLGLFQQRPSAGWGTPAQITSPGYAADAFLHALASYQHHDPAWATQPLW
ncbi:MAG TPA: hypothetical protein VH637_23825, partial [Streptosporangiaceae bacterium]